MFGMTIPDIPPGQQRNEWILANVDSFQPEFHQVGNLLVANDYFSIEGVRIPCDALTSEAIVAHFGGRLPIPSEVDAVWKASTVRLEPHPWGPPYDSSMLSTDRYTKYSAKIDIQINGRVGLISGHKKDVVKRTRLDTVAIYGWHRLNGVPIQQFNDHTHEATYADYSHGVRIIKDVDPNGGQ